MPKTPEPLERIYRDKDIFYEIDHCLPQKKAIEAGEVMFHWLKTSDHYRKKMNPKLS